MKTRTRRILPALWVFGLLLAAGLQAQGPQPDPLTLLPQPLLDRLADEVSGALIYRHTIELGGYERARNIAEYGTTYFETAYVEGKAREYGLSDVQVLRYPGGSTWHGHKGELWLVTPQQRLIISQRDIAASLVPGSAPTDVTADLVFVGNGAAEADYAGRDVRGKIVLTTGPIAPVVQQAVAQRGAIGIVSTHHAVGRPIDYPNLVAWTRVAQPQGGPPIFAFALPHRIGQELIAQVNRGGVTVRAVVEAETFSGLHHEVTVATVPGDGSNDQELIFVAHLFEGVLKLGAGDNAAGSGTILEVARAYRSLIDQGVLPQPKRTIRFVLAPEFSGTRPWIRQHEALVPRMLAAINMDMVGADLNIHGGNLKLYRNPPSLPSFVSDVAQQFFEYVGETNREKVHNRRIAYAFTRPIVDPTGTRDPFYYHIEKFYGSSDHTVFIDAGVPAIFFNHWPDAMYHTSEDRPAALDPTQLKRAAFIGLATAVVLANATEPQDAARLAALTTGYAAERVAEVMRESMLALNAVSPAELDAKFGEVRAALEEAYRVETEALRSIQRIAPGNAQVAAMASSAADSFRRGLEGDLARLRSAHELLAQTRGR